MRFLLDTINIPDIKRYSSHLPISGITCNPSIIKAEGHIDFYKQMQDIYGLLNPGDTFHIQVSGTTKEQMLWDAHAIIQRIGNDISIKVPTTFTGLQVIKQLKEEGINVTATAIYTKIQGLLAIAAGADYIAPYYNRMQSSGIDAEDVIRSFHQAIVRDDSDTKILAASFHNVIQVTTALEAGADAVTLPPALLKNAIDIAPVEQAVSDFSADWAAVFGAGNYIDRL
ncbi:fructose-6-phosphate aldolase [Lacticaseibacillus pabuli]|uniref:Fructose-6-phosphate aldolase n=1 Tax=Lacticaseibacillus pabuli TaxID=3025672 RepID=A0ABY7WQY9_9LACO|nr:fructose-6-phosphate aldolase [Lacticaseibacillus sp. KACC 23028]WDF82607.1 fructose-6-phosphate aldolase [Lacticaseibacillus sp. KACC 23028]